MAAVAVLLPIALSPSSFALATLALLALCLAAELVFELMFASKCASNGGTMRVCAVAAGQMPACAPGGGSSSSASSSSNCTGLVSAAAPTPDSSSDEANSNSSRGSGDDRADSSSVASAEQEAPFPRSYSYASCCSHDVWHDADAAVEREAVAAARALLVPVHALQLQCKERRPASSLVSGQGGCGRCSDDALSSGLHG